MIYTIHLILQTFIGLIFSLFFLNFLTPRIKSKPWAAIIFIVIFELIYMSVTVTPDVLIDFFPFLYRYSSLIVDILTVILTLLYFKDTTKRKILIYFIFLVNIVLSDVLSSVVFIAIGHDNPATVGKTIKAERIIAEVILIIFFSFLFYIFNYLIKKKSVSLNGKSFIISLLFPFSQIILLLNSVYIRSGVYSDKFLISIIIEVILCLITDVIIIKLFNSIIETDALRERIRCNEELSKAQTDYYNILQIKTHEIMKIRHEINDRLSTAFLLMETGNDSDKVKSVEILKDTHNMLLKTQLPVYCNNKICNTLINGKINSYAELHINYDFKLDIPDNIDIDDADICSVFSNLLNNAIESCKKFNDDNERYIKLIAGIKGEYLVINMENPIMSLPVKKNGKIITSKNNVEFHGFGLECLRNIAEKYEGKFDISFDDCCKSTLVLKAYNHID